MPPRTTVTPLDLANLKADITDEQMRIRHDQRAELATKLLIVDNLSVEQKLTNQTIQTMQKTLDTHQEFTKTEFQTLRKETKEGNQAIHDKLDKFIETANKTFATKEEHKENSNKIEKIIEGMSNINLKIATVSGIFTAIIFFINKIWN